MNYAERELLKAIAKAVRLMLLNNGGSGTGAHARMIEEALNNLKTREEVGA